jgi:hypothetical protein
MDIATLEAVQAKISTWKRTLTAKAEGLGEYAGAIGMICDSLQGELEDMVREARDEHTSD